MTPSIQQLSKIVKNFFQVGVWGEWFGQVFLYAYLLFEIYLSSTCGGPRPSRAMHSRITAPVCSPRPAWLCGLLFICELHSTSETHVANR